MNLTENEITDNLKRFENGEELTQPLAVLKLNPRFMDSMNKIIQDIKKEEHKDRCNFYSKRPETMIKQNIYYKRYRDKKKR